MSIVVVLVALLPHHFAAVVSPPSLTSVSYPTLTVQQYVPRRTSWRTFQMRHTEMGDVRALLDLIGIVSLGTPR